MNPFSSHLPPVFSQESNYSNDPYRLNVPFMSQLNFPAVNPRSESESLVNHMELSSNDAMMMMNDHHHHHHHHEQIVHNGCFGRGKKPVRKDKHSKIYTAQGLRDRRVRLSIGIAREFFDLQDMLGFDKPSKTLEWLLEKSRKEIQELKMESKKNLYQKEEDEEAGDDNDHERSFQSDSSSEYCEEVTVLDASRCKEKQVKRLENHESLNLGEESKRRTRLHQSLEKPEHFPEHVTQSQFLSRPAMCSMGGLEEEESFSRPTEDPNLFLQQDIIEEESIFIKRKLKSSFIPSYDFSFGSSSGSNNNNGIVNLSRDWDTNHLDSFDDSPAEMNTSRDNIENMGLNNFGKPW